jgi:ATP/maltotriose-dependent transcriptional regulator MalT
MGMAEKIRETTNSPLPPIDRATHNLDVTAIRSQLGESSFSNLWEAGRALTLEQAIDEALQIALMQEESTSFKPKPANAHHQLLSERELEILSLIAQGASNQEVAAKLILAVSTVKWYINILFEKLDVHSRTQAVARARELGLL